MKTKNGGAYKVNRMINEFHPNEIAMFGSSRMTEGLIPAILGPNFYNYGLIGTKTDVSNFLLNEEMKKKKTTPVIINIDLDGLVYETCFLSNYLYNINYKPIQQLIKKDDKFYYHIDVIKYFGFYQEYLRDYLNGKFELTRYTNNGASIIKSPLLPQEFADLVKKREDIPSQFSINTTLLNNLLFIITHHPDRKFIFVVAPCHISCFHSYKNEPDELKFLKFLQTYKNVRVLNYSRAHYPDKYFFDTMHLNYDGAVVYSKTIRDTLSKL